MVLIYLFACSGLSFDLTGEEELVLAAASGPEEAMVEGATPVSSAMPEGERPDPMRECDASGDFSHLLGQYDADGDGNLDRREEGDVDEARGFRGEEERHRVEGAWAMLLAVYDDDGSCSLEETERTTLLDDFTARCDALQARLLEEFDADGDGALSAEEEATARASLQSRAPEGAPPERGERPEGGPCEGTVPPPLAAYDTDSDGYFSADEYATMRPLVRQEVREGGPVFGPPPGH